MSWFLCLSLVSALTELLLGKQKGIQNPSLVYTKFGRQKRTSTKMHLLESGEMFQKIFFGINNTITINFYCMFFWLLIFDWIFRWFLKQTHHIRKSKLQSSAKGYSTKFCRFVITSVRNYLMHLFTKKKSSWKIAKEIVIILKLRKRRISAKGNVYGKILSFETIIQWMICVKSKQKQKSEKKTKNKRKISNKKN